MANTSIGKAYVQIIPSAQGIKGSITNTLSGEGEEAGTSIGGKIASFAKGAITAAAIGKFLADSVRAGAELEQALGGVETLFKDSSDTVKEYASQAFKTAQISATEYMETATALSASLINSLGGDTEKAAEYANRAILSMSDNANIMGTNIEELQTAYKGFSRGQFMMLDNLRLGYDGTKEEMQRLIKDASTMTDEMDKLGVTVDESSMSFDNIVNAIAVVQEHLGMTGRSAEEAEKTLSGSFNSMKAAAQDFMANLALGTVEKETISNLITSAMNFLWGNLVPALINIITQLPGALADAFSTIADWITEMVNDPALPEKGAEVVKNIVFGIISAIPDIIGSVGKITFALLTGLAEIAGELIQQGWEWISNLASGIWEGISTDLKEVWQAMKEAISGWLDGIWKSIVEVFESIKNTFSDAWNACKDIVTNVWNGIKDFFVNIWENIKSIFSDAAGWISRTWDELWNNVRSFFENIWNGIVDFFRNILDRIVGVCKDIWNGIKSIFSDEASESKTWGQHIGENLASGMDSARDVVAGAASRLAQAVADHLGHSTPKMGPLKNDDTFMPDMMENFRKGIEDNQWKVTAAVETTAGNIEELINPKSIGSSRSGMDALFPFNQFIDRFGSVFESSEKSDSDIVITIPIYIDGKEVTETVKRRISAEQFAKGRFKGQ